jgi:dihydroorotate dehydrogenase
MGINMGKSKSTPLDQAEEDYEFTFEHLRRFGDYFVVNVSSPNTPGLRTLQKDTSLARILRRLKRLEAYPLLVKISPDLHEDDLETVISHCEKFELDGIVATNTTTTRPETLSDDNRNEQGGLSGVPLEERATELVAFIARRTDLPIIGVGGISGPEDAYRKILKGASIVQLYTAFVYEGPMIARTINEGLVEYLEEDGYSSISEAVGAELD